MGLFLCSSSTVSRVGLFLCSSIVQWGGAVLQHQKWSGAVLQWFQRCNSQQFCVQPFVGHANLIRCIYWRLEERRDGAVSRVMLLCPRDIN